MVQLPFESSSHGEPPGGVPADIPLARPVTLTPPNETAPLVFDDAMWLRGMSRRAALLDVCLLAGVLIVFELALGFVAQLTWGPFPPNPDGNGLDVPPEVLRAAVVPVIALRAVVVILFTALILRLRRQPWTSVAMTRDRLTDNLLLGVATAAIAGLMILGFMMALTVVFPDLRRQMERNAEQISDMLPMLSIPAFLALAVVVGVWEELAFRGFMMTRLRRLTGRWSLAIIISTVIFTALHAAEQTPAALIAVSLLSITFSAVTIWRRSLVPAIVAHILWNFVQFMIISQLLNQGGMSP